MIRYQTFWRLKLWHTVWQWTPYTTNFGIATARMFPLANIGSKNQPFSRHGYGRNTSKVSSSFQLPCRSCLVRLPKIGNESGWGDVHRFSILLLFVCFAILYNFRMEIPRFPLTPPRDTQEQFLSPCDSHAFRNGFRGLASHDPRNFQRAATTFTILAFKQPLNDPHTPYASWSVLSTLTALPSSSIVEKYILDTAFSSQFLPWHQKN